MTRIGHIFRWDLDKTYLRSEFETVRDLVRTARKTAEQRENIPGSAALIRGIRESAPDGQSHQVYFVSGSPEQLRGVIERKFALDGFSPDGFVMKSTVSELIRGRFRVVRNQIPYKLGALLHGRANAPVGSKETLIGDDAESDAFIYTLYADLVSGVIPAEELPVILRRAGAYEDQIVAIRRECEAIVHERAVRRVIIHLDQRNPPATFFDFFPLVVPIYNHLQTALVLCLDRTLPARVALDVAGELIELFGFDLQQLVNAGEDLLRRRRSHYPEETLDRLAFDLVASADPVVSTSKRPQKAATVDAVREVAAKLAERAHYLRGRPLTNTEAASPATTIRRNYLELLGKEINRREEAKKAKKAAAKANAEEAEL